jgi:hypothetical protein
MKSSHRKSAVYSSPFKVALIGGRSKMVIVTADKSEYRLVRWILEQLIVRRLFATGE